MKALDAILQSKIGERWKLSNYESACLPVAGGTAYRAFFKKGGASPGECILVVGAGGRVALRASGLS